MPRDQRLGNFDKFYLMFFLKSFCIPLILQNPPANTIFLQTGSKQFEGSLLMASSREQAMLDYQFYVFPQKILQLILSGVNLILIFLIVVVIVLVDAPIAAPYWFLSQLMSSSVIVLSIYIGIYLFIMANQSLMNLLRFDVPKGILLKLENIGYPQHTGIISIELAPADTTNPEYFPVRQSGVTQLSPSQMRSTLSFLNMIFAIASRILRSVKTFSRIITVFPVQEQLIWEKKILQSSSSSPFSNFSISPVEMEGYFRVLPDFRVFLGTLSPTSPTLINSFPSSIMISSLFVFSIIFNNQLESLWIKSIW